MAAVAGFDKGFGQAFHPVFACLQAGGEGIGVFVGSLPILAREAGFACPSQQSQIVEDDLLAGFQPAWVDIGPFIRVDGGLAGVAQPVDAALNENPDRLIGFLYRGCDPLQEDHQPAEGPEAFQFLGQVLVE